MTMDSFVTQIIQCKIKKIANGPHIYDKYKENKHKIYKLMFYHDRILNVCGFTLSYVFICCDFVCVWSFVVYNIFTHM